MELSGGLAIIGRAWGSRKRGATDEDIAIQTQVHRAALDRGVEPIVEINTFDQAAPWLDMGIRMFSLGTTVSILHKFWREHGDGVRELHAQRKQTAAAAD